MRVIVSSRGLGGLQGSREALVLPYAGTDVGFSDAAIEAGRWGWVCSRFMFFLQFPVPGDAHQPNTGLWSQPAAPSPLSHRAQRMDRRACWAGLDGTTPSLPRNQFLGSSGVASREMREILFLDRGLHALPGSGLVSGFLVQFPICGLAPEGPCHTELTMFGHFKEVLFVPDWHSCGCTVLLLPLST